MIQVPGVVIFAAQLLIGPFGLHHGARVLAVFGLMVCALAGALTSQRSSHGQSAALLLVLGILSYESFQSITSWLHVELFELPIFGGREAVHFPSVFFTMNVMLGVIGAAAAVIMAILLHVRKTSLPLAKLFPRVSFLPATAELKGFVVDLSRKAGITPPALSLIDSGDPAAFITRSREGFELALSIGLLESLSSEELKACIAHELSHVKNNDFAVRSFATSARVALFAHPLSHLIEPALYRAREYLADKTAVQLMGGRSSLISALTKIRESQDYVTSQSGSIATACLFDSHRKSRFLRLFDKHPPLDARIRTLRELNLIE